jgi:hypothetical protein
MRSRAPGTIETAPAGTPRADLAAAAKCSTEGCDRVALTVNGTCIPCARAWRQGYEGRSAIEAYRRFRKKAARPEAGERK